MSGQRPSSHREKAGQRSSVWRSCDRLGSARDGRGKNGARPVAVYRRSGIRIACHKAEKGRFAVTPGFGALRLGAAIVLQFEQGEMSDQCP
jgi:hypothetical protein